MKRLLLAVLVVLGLAVTAVVGHAAVLPVTARQLTSFTASHPCPGQATATPSSPSGSRFTGVTLTLPSTACDGRSLGAAVLTGGGLVVRGTAVVSGSTATLVVPAYTAGTTYTVQAVVGGWNLPTSWSYQAPPEPFTAGNGTTVVQGITWGTSGAATCATVTVSTTTAQSSPWLVHLNIAAAPFNGATSGYYLTTGQVAFSPSSTPQNGVIGIAGAVNGWETLRAGQSRSFTVCR